MGNTVKTDNFLKAIKKHTNTQKKRLLSEVIQIKEEQISLARKKAEEDSAKLIAERLDKKRTEQAGVLAKKVRQSQRELFQTRAKMTDEIFEAAKAKLQQFTQTPEYRESLLRSANKIAELFGGNSCTLYIRETDMEAADEIKARFQGSAEIKADSAIEIGGVKGYCKAIGVIADDTLDSKLQIQREWFIENAELSVL